MQSSGLGLGRGANNPSPYFFYDGSKTASDRDRFFGTTEAPRRRWEQNAEMDLEEAGIDGAKWMQLARDGVRRRAFVNTVTNLRFP